MPTWSELQLRRRETDRKATRVSADEVLVLDARARMTPGNFVEEKLALRFPMSGASFDVFPSRSL